MPQRSRELGVLRIGKIAGLAVQSVLRWVISWRVSPVHEVIPSLVNTLRTVVIDGSGAEGSRLRVVSPGARSPPRVAESPPAR